MFLILVRSLLLILGALVAWLLASPWLSATIDHFFTVGNQTLPVGEFELTPTRFTFGQRNWSLIGGDMIKTNLRLAVDSKGRMTLGLAGRIFTFGPIQTYCDTPPDSYFQFSPDRGDDISFTKSRSWLPWPTPFHFSIMGAATTSWRRQSYYDLLWKKSSGAQIKMIWRDEQGYYSGTGWADEYLQTAPVITITPSPFEAAVERYLSDKKGWTRNEYNLESRGVSDERQCEVIAVIHSQDQNALHPGVGKSIELDVDQKTHQVIREYGGQ
jgi:hypothetical protein